MDNSHSSNGMSRREYLKRSLMGVGGMLVAPSIVPFTVFGKEAPSNKINIGQIGCGRIARNWDLPQTMKLDEARVMAVCDLDSNRKQEGKKFVKQWYAEKKGKKNYIDVKMYDDYHNMLQDPDIDAVVISTPDHWHAQLAIEAALAGKDIYLEKPASLTIEEGRMMSDIIHRTGAVFQHGTQKRSKNPWPQFRRACELVRNGRIGEIYTIKIGASADPSGGNLTPMSVPKNLDYEMWLGSTPMVPYTLDRVHPQEDFSRPGWLRCEQFGSGAITGNAIHNIDLVQWAMGTEYTGPVEVEAEAEFPSEDPSYQGLWNVHGAYNVKAKYANGVTMLVSNDYPSGLNFEGSEGWIFVSMGDAKVTPSDPSSQKPTEAFKASDPKILTSKIGKNENHLYDSKEQHANWLNCIKTRGLTVAPVEVAHRTTSACMIAHIAMKLPRKLYWDPKNERFKNDDEANAMLSRPQRYPYGIKHIKGLSEF